MGSRVKGSLVSIGLFVLTMFLLIFFYKSFLSTYVVDRAYPSNMDVDSWAKTLNLFFYGALAVVLFMQVIWYAIVWKCDPVLSVVRGRWRGISCVLILILVIGLGAFFFFYAIQSLLLNIYIAVFFMFIMLSPFYISTLFNYPEIKYCSGIWALFGR